MSAHANTEPYRSRDLPVCLGVRFLSEAATLALSVVIGWSVYKVSQTPLALGIVGIVQFIPAMLLTLPAGELCDRLSPRPLVVAGLGLQCVCALAFLALAVLHTKGLWLFYGVLLLFGTARAIAEPAAQALLPLLVPTNRLPRAVASSSTVWQMAVVLGPVVGGLCYAMGSVVAYLVCALAFFAAMAGAATLRGRQPRRETVPLQAPLQGQLARVKEGLAFVRAQPVVLGALSLDLFAVLLGGATALLPVYAQDILKVGPQGLGMLRSAPAVGACLVGLLLTRFPPERNVGPKLFAAVVVFGLATLVFAVSRSAWVSWLALAVVGASDMVSVNIRTSLIQLATPDAMRGRVSAVNALFIGASSELGAFESGVAAAWLGTVPAVALGGIGTIVAATVWMIAFPGIRKADRIDIKLG